MSATLRGWVVAVLVFGGGLPAWAQTPATVVGVATFNGAPVPGASVVATSGDRRVETTTDAGGVYRLQGLDAGTWTLRTSVVGFRAEPLTIEVPPTAPIPPVVLTLLPLADIVPAPQPAPRSAVPPGLGGSRVPTPPGSTPRSSTATSGNAPLGGPVAAPATHAAPPSAGPRAVAAPAAGAPGESSADAGDGASAADGFLINGSVNNGAASPFAQARAFGNARPGGRSLYSGNVGVLSSHSVLDARPYSFSGVRTPRPDYNDVQLVGTFGGPLRLPGIRNDPRVFVSLQMIRDHGTTARSALVPTAAEREGDFSQSRDPLGRPLSVVDPSTGVVFPGNRIPAGRLSPVAASLLAYYPQPNVRGADRFNFQSPIVVFTRQHGAQTTVSQVVSGRDQMEARLSVQRNATDTTNLFSFVDTARTTTVDASVNWMHRLSPASLLRGRYQVGRNGSGLTPYFSGRTNVSGAAGIAGNDQSAVNWGPPTLSFASGLASLSTGVYARNVTWTHGGGAELFRFRGRHNVTVGGAARQIRLDVLSQQDPRGGFTFTGAATGSDWADFLLGLPQASTIAFGNPDKRLRQWVGEAYLNDDWRVSPSLTMNVGVRWEFEAPMTEALDRLVNLDVAPGFTAVRPVVAAGGATTPAGDQVPRALLRADASGVLPRLGVAWRPLAGSSLVVRGGYGLYRNTNVYQSLAILLAQQPPLSTTATVASTPGAPLTLANGFAQAAVATIGTFGVDPNLRVGLVENWQASVQRDLPMSTTVLATYLGSRGHRLMQQFLPNTYPVGAGHPCPSCPSGFAYVTSTGRSLRHAAQLQVRRRLRNGFTSTVQYTLAKATDDAAALAGATLAGVGIAQNWLDLDAERARSNFDQRHLLTVQAQYTTGSGLTGGTLVDGVKGRLLKDWTIVSQLNMGSGLPVTPVYLVPVTGTGITGTLRPRLTGARVGDAPEGAYLNPLAYTAPRPGEWGDAGRNSVSGPAQFALNAAISRTFRMGGRVNLDWRIDASNVLNVVTYAGVNTLVGSPQFGLPNAVNQMRRLQSSLRMRF